MSGLGKTVESMNGAVTMECLGGRVSPRPSVTHRQGIARLFHLTTAMMRVLFVRMAG